MNLPFHIETSYILWTYPSILRLATYCELFFKKFSKLASCSINQLISSSTLLFSCKRWTHNKNMNYQYNFSLRTRGPAPIPMYPGPDNAEIEPKRSQKWIHLKQNSANFKENQVSVCAVYSNWCPNKSCLLLSILYLAEALLV